MRGTVIHAPGDIRLEERPGPSIVVATDAVVRTVATCVCGSDLWRYRGINDVPKPTRSATSTSAWSRPSGPM